MISRTAFFLLLNSWLPNRLLNLAGPPFHGAQHWPSKRPEFFCLAELSLAGLCNDVHFFFFFFFFSLFPCTNSSGVSVLSTSTLGYSLMEECSEVSGAFLDTDVLSATVEVKVGGSMDHFLHEMHFVVQDDGVGALTNRFRRWIFYFYFFNFFGLDGYSWWAFRFFVLRPDFFFKLSLDVDDGLFLFHTIVARVIN